MFTWIIMQENAFISYQVCTSIDYLSRGVFLNFSRYRTLCLVMILLVASAVTAMGADQFTPVLVSTLSPSAGAVLGTDGKRHVVYELMLTNANATPATLQKIEVLEESDPSHIVATYEGNRLQAELRTLGKTPVTDTNIEFNGARVFLVELAFDEGTPVPQRLTHRITLLGGEVPAPMPQKAVRLQYTVAPIEVRTKVLVIGPPLKGARWVALNGCCESNGAHRPSSQTVNGGLYFAQRFAIDWMRLDDQGRLLKGDASHVESYAGYGADVLAVADGTVVAVLDKLKDQTPGTLPDVKSISLETVDGNHVMLDLGGGFFAFYAHLQHGSVTVSPGDHVKRGQRLGKLGNSGNTSAPHLHFHIMGSPSVLGANGVPYVIDSFGFQGGIPAAKFRDSPSLDGSWNENMLPTPSPRHDQFPMDCAIIAFPAQ